jgi:hypothetical protein
MSDDDLALDGLDLTPAQERRLREVLTVYTGHDGRECVDATLWEEWAEWILHGSGGAQ